MDLFKGLGLVWEFAVHVRTVVDRSIVGYDTDVITSAVVSAQNIWKDQVAEIRQERYFAPAPMSEPWPYT